MTVSWAKAYYILFSMHGAAWVASDGSNAANFVRLCSHGVISSVEVDSYLRLGANDVPHGYSRGGMAY